MKYKLTFHPNDLHAAQFQIGYNKKRIEKLSNAEKADAIQFLETSKSVFDAWQKNMKEMIESNKNQKR